MNLRRYLGGDKRRRQGPSEAFTRGDIIAAYHAFLGRGPESEEVIETHFVAKDMDEMLRRFAESNEFAQRRGVSRANLVGSIDSEMIVTRHAVPNLVPREGHLVNFLGVTVPVANIQPIANLGGKVEGVPVVGNWHARVAEWGAALRSVELAHDSFTMIELGCGWGCWISNMGVAAKKMGLKIHVIGVEGDEGYFATAKEVLALNRFTPDEYTLVHGIASAQAGVALFPNQTQGGQNWGMEPIFDAPEAKVKELTSSGKYTAMPMVPLAEVIGARPRIDLIHMDIQGGEGAIVHDCLDVLNEKVAYLVIGTHSRPLDGLIMDILSKAGWYLEMEQPTTIVLNKGKFETVEDGLQAWLNPRLFKEKSKKR